MEMEVDNCIVIEMGLVGRKPSKPPIDNEEHTSSESILNLGKKLTQVTTGRVHHKTAKTLNNIFATGTISPHVSTEEIAKLQKLLKNPNIENDTESKKLLNNFMMTALLEKKQRNDARRRAWYEKIIIFSIFPEQLLSAISGMLLIWYT